VFVGHLGVFHNVDAAVHLANEILPRVRLARPEVELLIVGAQPTAAVRSLGRRPGVTVTGYVEDLNAVLNRATVFVAPLRFAAGVQNKVLEAMAAGRPVVTSPLVARGLGAEVGRHLLAADDAVEFADQVLALLADETRQAAIGAAGRAFVAERYRWELVNGRVAEIARQLEAGVGGAPASPAN
jgi:glycosyltransferase involved in cell wall biosynthesis